MKCADCKFFAFDDKPSKFARGFCRIQLPQWTRLTRELQHPMVANHGCDLGQALDLKPGPQDEAQRP